MNKTIFISSHPDDECLWGAYTIQRELPDIDVFIYRELKAIWRCDESREAMEYIGLPQPNLHFIDRFKQLPAADSVNTVYAPAMQGGHPFHDETCEYAIRTYGTKAILYACYTKDKTKPPFGRVKVEATERMQKRKAEALRYYESQRYIAKVHFDLESKDEFYF